jgi:hypothetical protein
MNPYLPALRPGSLVCYICLLAVLPHSLPAQATPEKAFSDTVIRFLRKEIRRLDEKITNRTESRTSPEAMKAKEWIRRIEAHPELTDDTLLFGISRMTRRKSAPKWKRPSWSAT